MILNLICLLFCLLLDQNINGWYKIQERTNYSRHSHYSISTLNAKGRSTMVNAATKNRDDVVTLFDLLPY